MANESDGSSVEGLGAFLRIHGLRMSDEFVEELSENTTGVWLVSSRRTHHLWDLDAGLYLRAGGATSQTFAFDEMWHRLTRVDAWPAVQRSSFVWFDDPSQPLTREQYRGSSIIRSIRRLERLGDSAPSSGTTQG